MVKKGAAFTYYRNGVTLNQGTATGTLPAATPLYFGGDAAVGAESWRGRLDDVATWKAALPLRAINSLARNIYTPDAAPLVAVPPTLTPLMSDDFSGTLAKWTATNRGLESNAAAGYNPPLIDAGILTLGGTTGSQYWFGSSLESVETFDSRVETEVSVRRVALQKTGSAARTSLWILGDNAHYLHFSQNLGENGWQYNARDDGGLGTLNPTGGGNNLPLLDTLDTSEGEHLMALRVIPGTIPGYVNVQILLNGQTVGTQGFTNFPIGFKVVLTGQARAINDTVTAQFDDVAVTRQSVANLPPLFSAASYTLATATGGTAYTATLAGKASDPENAALTYSKLSGPAWLTVAANGALSGTPGAADTGAAILRVSVSDPGGLTSEATVGLRVQSAAAPALSLYGWWPLNDGGGTFVRSVSGPASPGTLSNELTGGLGTGGTAWFQDPEYGTVLSFNGVELTGSFVTIGTPPDPDNIPIPDLTSDFTITCRAKTMQGTNNDIIIGNRYNAAGAEFTPRQFVKLTAAAFEWHWNGAGQNADFPDLPQDTWAHLTVVKDGNSLTTYRDGIPTATTVITGTPDMDLPIYFGGAGTLENWRGYLSDVRYFSTALSESQIASVVLDRNLPVPTFEITGITMDAGRGVTLTWPTQSGFNYAIWATTDLSNWVEVADSLTTGNYTILPGGIPDTATEKRIYFQIRAFAN